MRRMSLTSGTRLGTFEILGPLGAGGMGEVYRSRDTKLKREVAIKVLPAEWSQDSDRILRFRREAEVLATLNHPHIAQIYGLEESSGMVCLVLELVEGETLAERIQRGPVPIAEALEIARQIAEALEGAHERDIIHRDLKPANIKLTPDGKVKVLDFGLAKAMAPAGAEVSASQSPTIVNGSVAGVILGTAAYMSPEQCKGRDADLRSDVWSFGCVLYEMLTGNAAFDGETVVEILSATLRTDPDWSALPEATPASVRSLLKRCLQKDRKSRMRDIADARFQIEEAISEPASLTVAVPPARKGRERMLWMAGMAVLMVAVAVLLLRRAPIDAPEMRLEISTPAASVAGFVSSFAISPDGRSLVYAASTAGKDQLWLRPLDSETAKPLAGTDSGTMPFWSPDGQSVGFTSDDGQLKRVDVDSGLVRTIVPAYHDSVNTWNSDGTILFARSDTGGLWRIPAVGGAQTEVTRVDPPRVTGHWEPSFLPDGRHFVFFGWGISEYK
jgi:serine/threonine protein kinase